MNNISGAFDTPEKFLIAAGAVGVVFAILAPASVTYLGALTWTLSKRLTLGIVGVAFLIGGTSLDIFLPTSLIYTPKTPLTQQEQSAIDNAAPAASACSILESSNASETTSVNFINSTPSQVHVYWIDQQCNLFHYYDLPASNQLQQPTYVGHRWLVTDDTHSPIAIYVATKNPMTALIKQ